MYKYLKFIIKNEEMHMNQIELKKKTKESSKAQNKAQRTNGERQKGEGVGEDREKYYALRLIILLC